MSFAAKPFVLALAGLLAFAPVAIAQVGGGSELPTAAKKKGGMSKGMMKDGMMHHSMKHHSMKKKHKMM